MLNWLYVALITLIPGIELRGSIPVGILLGLNPAMVFLVAVILNILMIPLAFFGLDIFWDFLNRFAWFKKIVRKKKQISATSFTSLVLFVSIPLPGTGAYTGALVTKIFNLDKKMSFVAISIGVAIAGLLVSLISIGVLEFLKWMI